MTVREVFNAVLPAIGRTYSEAAAKIGWSRQQMSQKMARDSLRARDLLKIMEANGVEVCFRIKETGEIIQLFQCKVPGHGRRIKGMSHKVKYDTEKANALSNTFYADGKNEYDENGEAQELYVDANGRYFLAIYHKDAPQEDFINAIPGSIAAAFVEKYGVEIEKKPT